LGLPDVGVLVDTWHWTHGPSTLADLGDLPLAEIAYVQFDDHPPLESGDLLRETIARRALPGDGTFELKLFADTLKQKGYRAPVSIEILSEAMRSWPKDAFAKRVYEAAIRYWR
jgi:sugar phosphate isomerase/epimerase